MLCGEEACQVSVARPSRCVLVVVVWLRSILIYSLQSDDRPGAGPLGRSADRSAEEEAARAVAPVVEQQGGASADPEPALDAAQERAA